MKRIGDAMVIYTTWGTVDNNDWLNLMWGNGNYGVLFNLGMAEKDDKDRDFIIWFRNGCWYYMEMGLMFATQNSDDGTDADQP